MHRCVCGKYTNYGPTCAACSADNQLEEGSLEIEDLDKEIEERETKED